MRILGLSDGPAPSAALVSGGDLVAGATQSLSRPGGFPWEALDAVLRQAACGMADVDRVVFGSHLEAGRRGRPSGVGLLAQLALKESGLWAVAASRRREVGAARLRDRGFRGDVKTVDHFQALAEAAWRTQPWESALVFTASRGGDGTTITFSSGGHDGLCLLYRQGGLSALRDYRLAVADVLAEPPDEALDPVPFLALRADAPADLAPVFHGQLHFHGGGFGLSMGLSRRRLARVLASYTPVQVAAAWQMNLEGQFRRVLRYWLRRTGLRRVALGGDLFANPLLVSALARVDEVKSLSVCPQVGDPALAAGAAMRFGDVGPMRLTRTRPGPALDEQACSAAIRAAGLMPDGGPPSPAVAQRLAAGDAVLRVAGRAALGPGSLGSRSLLLPADDPERAPGLGKRLGLNPLVPPCALTLAEEAERCFEQLGPVREAARLGAVCLPATPWMEAHCPGALFGRGMARPLCVEPGDDPELHAILTAYRDLTGLPCLLSGDLGSRFGSAASTPREAVRLFRSSGLPAMILGRHLLTCRHPPQRVR